MNDNNFSFEDLFGTMFDNEPATAAKPAAKETPKAKKAEVPASKKAKKATVKVSDRKVFSFGAADIAIPKDAFAKANVPEETVCEAFVKLSNQTMPAKAFTVKRGAADSIVVGYSKNVMSDGDSIPGTIMGFRIVTPDGSFDLYGDVTVNAIRAALSQREDFAKYADPAYGFVVDDYQILVVPVASKFTVPFAETIVVENGGESVTLSFAKPTTESSPAAKPSVDEDDEADGEDDEVAVDSNELTSAEICWKFVEQVKKGTFELAKRTDGTIFAFPSTQNGMDGVNVALAKKTVPEDEIERPITPDLKICWGLDELSLYNLAPEGDKPGTIGLTTISEKKALEILKARFPQYRFINHMTWFEEGYWWPNYPSSTKGGGAVTPLFSVEGETVVWLAPKIPGVLLAHIVTAFCHTEANSGVEQAAAILFNTKTRSWRISFPTQEATPVSVTCNYAEEAEIPFEFVGVQMHSHPNMSISFSEIDDRDEQAEGTLYCVVRRHGRNKSHVIDCRVRYQGRFLPVSLEVPFDLP